VTREPRKHTAASIRARLLSLAQSKGEDYQRVLGRYAIERFLYRLGRSPYRDKFALKGATLFTLWTGQGRASLLGLAVPDSSALGLSGLCQQDADTQVPDDCVSITAEGKLPQRKK
jgi:hypothetical protein